MTDPDALLERFTLVSGGQTGADRAALDWAIGCGVPHGGWCPRGRLAEDGMIPDRYRLRETPSADYAQRTEWNVRDSDATLIVSIASDLQGGSRLTQTIAERLGKPCLHVARDGADASGVRVFLVRHGVQVLNVAGPCASREPDVYTFTLALLDAEFPTATRPSAEHYTTLAMKALFALLVLFFATISSAAPNLSSGPMAGHATTRTASIWLQADGPGTAQLEYWKADDPTAKQRSAPVDLHAATDFAFTFELVALDPGTRYEYRVLLAGKPVAHGERLFVRTQPLWKWRANPPDLRVFLGSCAYVNDPPYDRPGSPYGGDYFIFETIAARARATPVDHLMLWLGDNLYFREVDYESPWGMNLRWRRHRALPALQPLLAATRHYAIWDDHDYGPNDANRSFVFKGAALELFQRYWTNPSHGLPGTPGIFSTFSYLDADFFLLDDRWYRSTDRGVADAERTMLGRAQLDWLKQALTASTATFKFIANGSQLLNDASRYEGWHNYPQERDAFLDWLARQRVKGVVFLSGDRHHTELLRRERPGAYPLYELTCSPLTAGMRINDDERENPMRVPGTLVMGARSFCTLDLTGPRAGRKLVFRAFSANGRELWAEQVRGDTLRPPAK